MRLVIFIFFVIGVFFPVFAQQNPKNFPPNMPPEAMEMYKKIMAEQGIKIPNDMGLGSETQELNTLISIPPFQVPPYTPNSSPKFDYSPFGSGRTEAQRKAMLLVVNGELELKPYILPKKKDAPSKIEVLKIASIRNKSAQLNFATSDFSKYAQAVTWNPKFDGINSDPKKAEKYSMYVSTSTLYSNSASFMVALSSAVFELDPSSHVASNNFAVAIKTDGEILIPTKSKPEILAGYQKDAESVFLYALSISMKDSSWNEESLIPMINLGNLYIDMGRLEEARSLFQVARKISPYSWNAALGLAAYFHAINQPDKALAIMEDDDLDRPEKYLQAVKSSKILEKSDKYTDLTLETPETVYQEGIKIMAAEPILTSADFVSQLDQSERNKMTYFVEHLAPEGSFEAPTFKYLEQFSSLKAISSPAGICALKDFSESMAKFSSSSSALMVTQQIDMASRMGLNIKLDFDLNDAMKNPEKYKDKLNDNSVKIEGMEKFMNNVDDLQKQNTIAERDLTTKKTASLVAIGASIDPFLAILQLDPDRYADPMNIIIQKHNGSVYTRKAHLYNGYIYSINNRIYKAVSDVVQKANKKIWELEKARMAELEALGDKQYKRLEELIREDSLNPSEGLSRLTMDFVARQNSGPSKEEHAIHVKYFNLFNNTAEVAFNSSTNLIMPAYTQKIKPALEAYYYDVIRHIALISDPEVRIQKEAELRSNINSAISWSLHTILLSYGSFSYHDDWDCSCDPDAFAKEKEEIAKAENARILKNKGAKAQFDSGEIPEASPLYKKIDAYGTNYDFFFMKGRVSCAKTTLNLNVTVPIQMAPEISFTYKGSQFSKAMTIGGGIKINPKAETAGGNVKIGASLGLSGSLTTDGTGSIKDYSVTATSAVTVSTNGTTIKVGGEMSYGPKGPNSDMSAGITRDFSNKVGDIDFGGSGKVSFEASTKTGCSLSGKVEQSLAPYKKEVDDVKKENYGKDLAKAIPTDQLFQKEFWSGKFKTK